MGKWHGKIGFGFDIETEPDIHDDKIVERPYYGDVLQNRRSFDQSDNLSGDVKINNQLSIVGDDFLFKNLENIRYVTYKSKPWMVTVEECYPRITVNLGGIYHGQTPET